MKTNTTANANKNKVNKNKANVNEAAPDLATVAAGVAAVIGSGVGLAGLMEYLKNKYPDVYAALSDLGSAANDSRTKGVNESLRIMTVSESLRINEAKSGAKSGAKSNKLSDADMQLIKLIPGGLKAYDEFKAEDPKLTPSEHVIQHFEMLLDDSHKAARRFYNRVEKVSPKLAKEIVKRNGDNFMFD